MTSTRSSARRGPALDVRTTRRARTRRWVTALAALLLALLFVQAASSMRLLSLTSDELTHIPSGYTYLRTGEYRLNPQHPPLVKLLAAAPLLGLPLTVDLQDPTFRGEPPREWEFGFRFFEANDADRVLFRARLPIVLLTLLGGFFVFRWGRDLFGPLAGLSALFLYAVDPNVVAHSRFVTMDVPLATFFLMTIYYTWRWVGAGRWRHLVAAGLSLGAALATKFSAVILVPLLALLLALAALAGRRAGTEERQTRAGARGTAGPDLARRLARAAGVLLLLLALATIVVFAAYGFPADPLVYWKGARQVNVDHDPDYPYYLLGDFRKGGFWYYFPAAFLFKTPLPTLLLLGLSLALYRRHRARRWLDDAFVAVPAVVFFLFTSTFADNLGVRYLLPVYPLLFVWIARLAPSLASGAARERKVARAAAAGLAVWYAVGASWIYPDQLAFFNLLAGGPANGHRVLDDSNIDWGQDLKRLKAYMEREGIERVHLLYGGNASPDYYQIDWVPVGEREWAGDPEPGVYAVSTHLLIRGEHYARTRRVKTDWLNRYEPIGRVGYSIYLFRFP